MKSLLHKILSIAVLLGSGLLHAQTDLIAPALGSVSGLVQSDSGVMVPPQAAVQATVTARDTNGVITAEVEGTASCIGVLGLHFAFAAQYNATNNTFTGMYSDLPGTAPDKALIFNSNGGSSWTASLSGNAPSPKGERNYELSLNFEIPQTAIFAGNSLPRERTYQGSLASTVTVAMPLSIPQAGINENVSFDVAFSGDWSAVSVPKVDGSSVFTGHAKGSFASTNTVTVSGFVPGLGTVTIPVSISGYFGGTLFLIDDNTVSFRGAWVGVGTEQTFGGDTAIEIRFQDTSAFPFTMSGTLPVATGVPQLPLIQIPFSASGSFPLALR